MVIVAAGKAAEAASKIAATKAFFQNLRSYLAAYCLALATMLLPSQANELDLLPYNEGFDGVEIELLLSYKLISRDHIATRESYKVSHVMHYKGERFAPIGECEIDASGYPIMDDMPYFITSIIKQEKSQVLECLYGNEVKVTESTQGRDNALRSKVSLEIPPTRVRAKLVDKSIMLTILSKDPI